MRNKKNTKHSCSPKCRKMLFSGKNNANFTTGVRYKKSGYKLVYTPEHPNARSNYMLEHRLLVERKLGRLLTSDEVVHHINYKKHDNSIDNLVPLSLSQHRYLHHNVHLLMVELLERQIVKFNHQLLKYEVI